ncbi:MAG: sugar phosphate nucleotidyltransferase [Candidatus Woesearchaeota archaeon]|jgi:glucose-1-phosphate cytidylyltransferase|nr:sugar phosphate nucleotidyltransferase [Candidatus Woesearchaeota archaeon]
MKTVILCGGEGTRLKELTEGIPKPLVEIGGKPILWHIMKIYSSFGFNDFVLCLGYKGEMIEDYFKNNKEDWKIEFVDTGAKTNTGGRIKKVEEYVSGRFLATYGDGLADIDLKGLVDFHDGKKKIATMTCVNPLSQFGVLDISDDLVMGFREKPPLNQWINGGFFVFEPKIFEYLTDDCVLEKEPFEKLAIDKQMAAYKFEKYWDCMDTFKDMQTMNKLWKDGSAPWKRW